MSRHEINDPWPSIYWKHSDSALQLHSGGYKSTILSYGKRGETIQLWEESYSGEITSYWVCIPLSLKSKHSVQPPSSFLIVERTSLPLSYELAFGGGLKWWRPNWKEIGFLVSNHVNMKVCNVDTSVDELLIEILLSRPIYIFQIYDYYPWACL